jgi:hypothetical protein
VEWKRGERKVGIYKWAGSFLFSVGKGFIFENGEAPSFFTKYILLAIDLDIIGKWPIIKVNVCRST